MKVRTLILITFITGLIFLGCDKSPKQKKEPELKSSEQKKEPDLKSGALDFSLKVVRSFIENDTTVFKTFFADTVYFLESHEEPRPTSSIPITELFSQFDYSDYTMDDFNNNYSSQILKYNGYKNEKWVTTLEYWHPDSEDYLFIAPFIEGGNNFMWDDLLIFVVTKRSGEWKIRAFAG